MSTPQSLPEREREILAFWEQNNIFARTQEQNKNGKPFVFFEGPPTANGKPGIHHVEARAFKDIIPRFRSMQGYFVDRKAGWDTQGLAVEIEVEKKLGFTGKKDIETYGIAKFNDKCKESVWKYLDDWIAFTKRIGFWIDLDHPYVTYHAEYIESLWWILKQVYDKGLLYKDYKVVPYCARCGTPLSSHELAQGYADVKDLSVTAKFKVTGEKNTYLLTWTTTPWTLPGNVGLAVGKNTVYVKVKKAKSEASDEYFWLAKERLSTLGDGYEVMEEKRGSALVGWTYEPLYPFLGNLVEGDQKIKLEQNAYKVYAADFVTTEDGTGIVHTAVMYGQDDFELGNKVGLPKHHLVGLDGKFVAGTGDFAGRFVKEEGLDVDIVKDLAHRGLLFDKYKYEHSYPHCWRCKTPLIYYAKDSWYIAMSKLREKLLEENAKINWEPAHIQNGRFGEWLREVKDWAISRERYWATPLPMWESADGDRICIGSFEELRSCAKEPSLIGDEFDPHRPFVDDIVLMKNGKEYRRVPDVIDVWFDSGAMPFAQWHYPFENKEKIDGSVLPLPANNPTQPPLEKGRGAALAYPADYIAEAIDQTRGWFYTLLAVAVLLGKERSFKNVICLGHLLDANGEKMSKSKGNVVDPIAMIEKYGADPVRWYMYTITQPGDSKRFDEKILNEMRRKVFMTLENVKQFYLLYAPVIASEAKQSDTAVSSRAESRDPFVHRTINGTLRFAQGDALHRIATSPSAPRNDHILDRWILARLHELTTRCTTWLEAYKVTEPARAIADFVTDLSTWYVRRSRERFKEGEGVETLRIVLLTLAKLMAPFTPFFAETLYKDVGGVKDSVHLEHWPAPTPPLPPSGMGATNTESLIRDMEIVRKIVELGHAAREQVNIKVRQPVATLRIANLKFEMTDPAYTALIREELNVKDVVLADTITEEDGWVIKTDGGLTIAIDTRLTDDLKSEGTAREFIRLVNAERKARGLTIKDMIAIVVKTPETLFADLDRHRENILRGTLARSLDRSDTADGPGITINGIPITIHIV